MSAPRSTRSIRNKLTLRFVVLLSMIGLGMLAYFPNRMMRVVVRSERERVEARTTLLADALASAVDFDSAEKAGETLEDLTSTRGALSASVARDDGSILKEWKHSASDKLPALTTGALPRIEETASEIHVYREVKGITGATATLRVAYTLDEVLAERRSVLLLLVGIAALIVFVGGLGAWLLGGSVARPIVALTMTATEIVRTGQLILEIDTSSDDEVGLLAQAFGDLLGTLRRLLSQVSALSTELEKTSEHLAIVSRSVLSGSDSITTRVSESDKLTDDMLRSLGSVAKGVDGLGKNVAEATTTADDVKTSATKAFDALSELTSGAEATASAISKVAETLNATSQAVLQLDDSIESVSHSTGEVQGLIEQVRERTQDTAGLSREVESNADACVATLGRTLEGLARIQRSSQQTAEDIDRLNERIGEIPRVLELVDDISAMTNLLSLNANVIAAQAGEQGRGFSVVAQEIKGLASRSAGYTQQIAELVEAVQSRATSVVQSVQVSVEEALRGVELGHETETSLHGIQRSAVAASRMTEEIVAQTRTQAEQVRSVTNAAQRMSEASKRLAVGAKAQAAEVTLIERQSSKMRELAHEAQTSASSQGESAERIGGVLDRTAALVGSLRDAQHLQTEGSERVQQAVRGIDRLARSQQNAVRELESAVRSLRKRSEELEAQIHGFEF